MVKNQVLNCAEGFFLQKEKNKAINSLYPFQMDASFLSPWKHQKAIDFSVFKGVNGNFGIIWIQPEIDIQTFPKFTQKILNQKK